MASTRRRWLAAFGAAGAAAVAGRWGGAVPAEPLRWQRLGTATIARFRAGAPGRVDLSDWLSGYQPGVTRLRLRLDIPGGPGALEGGPVTLQSQCPEFSLDDTVLRFDGSGFPSLAPGGAAVRVQLEAGSQPLDSASAVEVAEFAVIRVDAPAARIRHGLDAWDSFAELLRSVRGDAPAGSAPTGRTDLIGASFEITPGLLTEQAVGSGEPRPAPVAVLPFPCTVRAQDPARRPVLCSATGRRDIVQIESAGWPAIDGEVVLQDLVIRDNRAWYNSGEAGVRIKDRSPGRSVRVERCELLRCQNAVAGGSLGQTLRVLDCRIVDCGFGTQAHGLYVQPEWLEFFGNVVTQSPGNRLAQAHLLKSRALNARILGNRFVLNDCPGSYLIDLPNGGDVEIGGNLLHYGPASDNTSAVVVAYAPEGAAGDFPGPRPTFSPARPFRLVMRNNTIVSDFPGRTEVLSLHVHAAARAEGGEALSEPQPLVVADNLLYRRGQAVLLQWRDRRAGGRSEDRSATLGDNAWRRQPPALPDPSAGLNRLGPYEARRFTGQGRLGTGHEAFLFTRQGGA